MKIEALKEKVKEQMTERRWQHTLGVMESAAALAKKHGADVKDAYLAGLLHDYAKYWPLEKQRQVIIEGGLPQELLLYSPALWHGPVAAHIAKTELGIHHPDVLNAIYYHTSGREGMSKLEKVVCLADYIEPGRQFPQVEHIRELAGQSLEKGLIAALDSTIQFLIEKGHKIYPLTIRARNYLIEELEAEE